jgi:hypothetical protein
MSKSRNSRYRDRYDDDMEYDYNPYGRKSEYLEKKRAKRMQRAMKTRDVDGLLEQNDDYDDDYVDPKYDENR